VFEAARMTGFKDLFSGHAAAYAAARPTYPDALFDWLTTLAPVDASVLDCGCGNGQASLALAERFARVVATDPSAEQIANAPPHPRIEYRVAAAEASGLPDASVQLVTAAQAVHWFDHTRFAAECRRVLVPDGVVAVWVYGVNRITPELDAITLELYQQHTGPYWAPERRHIDQALSSLYFPFTPVETPAFAMRARWTLDGYLAYLRTWSSCQKYQQVHGADPVSLVAPRFAAEWGDADQVREVVFPLHLRVGQV
jgi:ubiquinone/menaquinone biosynthesis C-methylase UbiE